jgi:site-specific DNA-methyltransferase (adenine-specific)
MEKQEINNATLYLGDCAEVLKTIETNSIDLTVTSPPYDNLRTYNGYCFNFEDVAKELFRVTKNGGVVVWVVGDATINGSETGTSFKQALFFKEIGFNIHDTMIYQKHNFSNPSSNRYHQIFEFMFVLSKGKPKTFNPIKDRKNVFGGQIGSWGKNTVRQKDGSFKENSRKINSEFGSRYNIWKMNTEMNPLHPAPFPIQLAHDHIISWSNKGETILDPFLGSGTTGKVAKELNRNFVGIEISQEYLQIAKKRIEDAKTQERCF